MKQASVKRHLPRLIEHIQAGRIKPANSSARLPGLHWDEPERQPQTIEVLCSTERDGVMTPVFGTTLPPRGASGMLRRAAFRYTESDLRHWLLLLLADRTNMAEGVVDDLRHGHVPNVPKEMGLRAAWKHDRAGVTRKLAVGAGVLAALIALRAQRKRMR